MSPEATAAGRSRPRRATTVRPSAYGAGLVAVVAGVALFRPGVADPFLGATVWVAAAVAAAVGLVVPAVVVAAVRVELASPVDDLDVGSTRPVALRVHRARATVELAWDDRGSGWYRLPRTGLVTAPWAATRRGVHHHLPLLVRSGGPLGLVVVTRRIEVPLGRPLHVGPAPIDAAVPLVPPELVGAGAPAGSPAAQGETVRGVRPYVPGDPSHLVHWPSSARVGHPMVRELERPARPGMVVVVALDPAHPPAAHDRAASEAAGIVLAALRSGSAVQLCTVEGDDRRSAPVGGREDLRRRLARADVGVPAATGPEGWPRRWVVSDPSSVVAGAPWAASAGAGREQRGPER